MPLRHDYRTAAARRVAARVDEVFAALEHLPFLRPADRQEFRYFRRIFRADCAALDGRVDSGELKPWPKRAVEALQTAAESHRIGSGKGGKPTACLALPPGRLHLGVFTGSFDPFQMTHLETALRYLARGVEPADLVAVVPEGAYSAAKPGRSDYGYRFDILRRQVDEPFRPFVVPVDVGRGQDTIGIVRRLIELLAGREVRLTHVLGSDAFPQAARWYPEDLVAWREAARRSDVKLDFDVFVVKRRRGDRIAETARRVRAMGIPVAIDPKPIGTPSSTDLREHGMFTIVFPTAEVLEKLEVVFRYGMHRNWRGERGGAEYEI
jgi:hypothetical protein